MATQAPLLFRTQIRTLTFNNVNKDLLRLFYLSRVFFLNQFCRVSSSFERFERDDFTSVNGIGCVARQVVAREKDRDERKARIDFVNATNLVSIGLVGESSWAVRFFCASSFTQANLSGSSAAFRVNRVCLAWSRSFEF